MHLVNHVLAQHATQPIQHLIKLQPQRISLSLGIIAAQQQVRVLAF